MDDIDWTLCDGWITHWVFDGKDGEAYWAGGMSVSVKDGKPSIHFSRARGCNNFGRLGFEGSAIVERPKS